MAADSAADEPRVTLSTTLKAMPGIGWSRADRFARLGLRKTQDVLFFFPRDHQFPPPPTRVDELREGQPATLIGRITECELASRSPGKSVFGAIVENESGAVRLLFFNQPFRADQLKFGVAVRLSGAPKLAGLRWEFTHPKYEILDDEEFASAHEHQGEILPVYPLTEGVKEYELRQLTRTVCNEVADQVKEVMPEPLRIAIADALKNAGMDIGDILPSISQTLRSIHCPASEQTLNAAKMRLVFQELFVMQLALAMRRQTLTGRLRAPPMTCSPQIKQRILRRFPFELTGDQLRVIETVASEMQRQFPMNRLLQGDVGSGKTVVAIFAMMMAVACGHQATIMVPTEVLARQHFRTLTTILADSQVKVGLLCGSLSASQRRETLRSIASGEINLIVGTQALIFDIEFHSLGLCVIDEQHKFGVKQRVRLRLGGIDPHYLVMSATPIPRSVAMTQFGDVDLSTLREKPSGRGEVHTYLASDGWKNRWWEFIRQRVAEGRQVYVVAPRVGDESETPETAPEDVEDVTSVNRVYEQLSHEVFPELRVELLHGRMKPEAKQAVMDRFAEGEIDILVTTTVIEVGVDVANATVMTILGGNRFGLAQLHQLRGRVSRGVHAGHVCVFTDGERSPEDSERLKVFEQTSDGFELAEADFRLRGPGDLLGQKQSGLPPLRIADLSRDVEVLKVAREMAQELIDEDPIMDAPELAMLKEQVLRRYGERLDLGDGA
ncbi:ATP-dependent DNA helicase RecG [Neorhodopirellula pilleata]|uniref:Probable DNA 3'-5' helicase RecG n=1 Tax=Neorhodopirellula pilleata TaxID=2714738 RepID=A0A5C6AU92_9BACT|nr:ATP-dependent DNA helicase RecG [Neorhodopirellula pilleata]